MGKDDLPHLFYILTLLAIALALVVIIIDGFINL